MFRKLETMWTGELGITEYWINLNPNAKPLKLPPYRAGPKTKELEQFELREQLKARVRKPAISEWVTSLLFEPKNDGKLHSCIEYPKLNTLALKDTDELQKMDFCIDCLRAKVFTALDEYPKFWHMNMRKEDRPKTVFACHVGSYQYNRTPFGLTNAVAKFQLALDMILTQLRWETCLVYVDDVIIYLKIVADHIHQVEEILTALKYPGGKLKTNKCYYFLQTIEYLDHTTKSGKVEDGPREPCLAST